MQQLQSQLLLSAKETKAKQSFKRPSDMHKVAVPYYVIDETLSTNSSHMDTWTLKIQKRKQKKMHGAQVWAPVCGPAMSYSVYVARIM